VPRAEADPGHVEIEPRWRARMSWARLGSPLTGARGVAHPALKPRILVVARDGKEIREIVGFLTDRGYDVTWAKDGEAGYNALDSASFDAMVAELKPQRVLELRLLILARQRNPEICVVLLTSRSPDDIELATEAMRLGAYDFQLFPWNLEKLAAVIERGLSHQELVLKYSELNRRVDKRFGMHNIIGNSPQMVRIYTQIKQIAPTQAMVLIQGETGTGKELVAQAIHSNSTRKDERFVKLDCTALAPTLIESELFGHEKGAFTGAVKRRPGRFEIADGGTLFLDEVGDIPGPAQAKLLRVLQDREFERVGGVETIKTDVRVVCATHRNLADLVDRGEFRHDLYYRLNVVTISLPPLRERRSDIPLFVEHFIRRFNEEHGKDVAGITRGAMDRLMAYDWPGNVRELRNTLEGVVALSSGADSIDVGQLPVQMRSGDAVPDGSMPFRIGMSMKEIEMQAIVETLRHTGDDKQRTAEILGIGLRTLYRKLKQYSM
jgi:DNA-binding NtrC family response regulator